MNGDYLIKDGEQVNLAARSTGFPQTMSKKEAEHKLAANVEILDKLQQRFYASGTKAVLIIFQGMDTSGKDSCIRHIFSGINPQGCSVVSFKQPTHLELSHDFMWRHYDALPAKGFITIFNRSYYENVLITRVHPELLLKETLPGINTPEDVSEDFWKSRYETINAFEKQLAASGTLILKFFLHISKEEQKNRLLQRIDDPEKNWKFQYSDLKERRYWRQYSNAYESMLCSTSTEHARWYVIPADQKWLSRVAVSNILVAKMEEMNSNFPVMSDEDKQLLLKGHAELKDEYGEE